MSTEIVKAGSAVTLPQRGGALSLGEMSPRDAWLFCESLADTPLLPDAYRRNPASVLWALEYGRALGLDVVTTITTIHVIKGKPSQSADLMLSRTRSAGHKVRIRQEPGSCTVSIWRSDDPDFENTVTWTFDDAVTAGLCEMRNDRPYSRSQKNEPQNWEKYPRAMLRARAISECVRTACPEVLHGAIYTPEELGARVDGEGLPMEAEVQQLRAVPAGEPDPWATAAPQRGAEFEPHAAAQALAKRAADAKTRDQVNAIADEAKDSVPPAAQIKAPDTEQQDTLREYLARRWKALPEQAEPTGEQQDDDVPDAEIVGDSPQDDHAAAVAELREAAEAARLEDFDGGARMALGMPIDQASPAAIRALAAQIRPAA